VPLDGGFHDALLMFFGTVSWPEFEISVYGKFGAASKKAGVTCRRRFKADRT
jgi:hypothetical protein